ncbi:Protein kinase-like (PK-like) [Glarea lozoyensis ATCC 20868]|uniref:Protein kinase-like (PK-like) n=1 Tax=Glarea lozoyensis (strain ATCC 20868 / MF5171) TaxID=1116229 RepID=S3D8M4_GLAL2|nr:Protein kinase-like (PK-like) [Glarea lozoyensis ATCC 20868]EPE34095.1 Protein kinase-like (PK-like) [Glarea lozoyensis ATCC 20868]
MSQSADGCPEPVHAGDITRKEEQAGILPSHGISLDVAGDTESGRPPILQHLSAPAYHSPLRHHKRQASYHKQVKETLNAKSEYTNNEDDGRGEHRINQYIIKDEIGRGSFGAVHLAVDQYGKEYAVKEFSKSRLRKRAQSNILRRPHAAGRRPGHLAAGLGFNAPLHRHPASDIHNGEEKGNPLYLIKEEIAIMKKLNHPNLVSLIEVLDDPEEDSLYMVLEMCKKGVVMKVGLGEQADPYDMESCRCWFRDLILGIEYLHAQGVAHRDIKPDNLLLTDDDVLKIVDFGVSEMFEKQSEMLTAKSAGSPAFLPPELCVTKHGDISGKAADIWSMGVSLYCLRFGKIPFEKTGVLELYEAIKSDDINIESENDPDFCDLMRRLLTKDPEKRIKMPEIRNHPWVTKGGTDPLLSAEENTADLVEPPSDIEVNHAITSKMRNLLTMMKAVKKFKGLVDDRRPPGGLQGILGKGMRSVKSPETTLYNLRSLAEKKDPAQGRPQTLHETKSLDLDDRRPIESVLSAQGVHHDLRLSDAVKTMDNRVDSSMVSIDQQSVDRQRSQTSTSSAGELPRVDSFGEKGHAHDPLDEQPLFLGIGAGDAEDDVMAESGAFNQVAESPTAAEFSIYDTAYEQEVERIRAAQGSTAKVYLTRRVDRIKRYTTDDNMIKVPKFAETFGSHTGFKSLLERARDKQDQTPVDQRGTENQNDKDIPSEKQPKANQTFSELAAKLMSDTKEVGKDLQERGGSAINSLIQKATEKKNDHAAGKSA